ASLLLPGSGWGRERTALRSRIGLLILLAGCYEPRRHNLYPDDAGLQDDAPGAGQTEAGAVDAGLPRPPAPAQATAMSDAHSPADVNLPPADASPPPCTRSVTPVRATDESPDSNLACQTSNALAKDGRLAGLDEIAGGATATINGVTVAGCLRVEFDRQ